MKSLTLFSALARRDVNMPLVLWIWRAYFRASLIPLLCVEVVLITLFFFSNSVINDNNEEALRQQAQTEVKQLANLEAKVINQQLLSIAQSTQMLQDQTAQIMLDKQPRYRDDPSRFKYSKDGVFYTPKDNGAGAVFYSGLYQVDEPQRQKAYRSAGLDLAYIGVKQSNPLITQVYYNTYDSLIRIYPYIDVIKRLPAKIDLASYNFYYQADAQHNPQRKVIWTEVYNDLAGQGWMTSAIAPVYNGNKLEGVVGVDVTIKSMAAEVSDMKIPWQGYGLLLSRDGTIMALPEHDAKNWSTAPQLENADSKTQLTPVTFNAKQSQIKQLLQTISHQDHGMLNVNLGSQYIIAWSLIPETGWKMLITIPEDKLLHSAHSQSQRINTLIWLVVLGLVAFYFIFFVFLYYQAKRMSKLIAEPLERLDAIVKQVSAGKPFKNAPTFNIAELDRTAQGVATMGALVETASQTSQLAELQLEQRNRQLQSVIDLSTDGFILTNANAEVVLVNPALCQMTGLKAGALLFKPASQFWHALVQLSTDHAMDLPGLMHSFRLELQAPVKRILQCQILDVNADDPSSAFKLIQLRDITQDVELNQMKSQFIATAAHELRTPLTSVLGYSELLMKDMVPPDMRETAFEVVVNKTKLVMNIINELLDLARIEARHGLDFDINAYFADQLVKEVIATYTIPKGRQPIIVHTLPKLRINVDVEKFKGVLTNLLDNAYKYSTTGEVQLLMDEVEVAGQASVAFRIKDVGIGMNDDQIKHAFDRFWRADNSGDIPGTGLGLSIVNEVMRVFGGSVVIESALGEGTTVSLYLPQAFERRARKRKAAAN
jgi:signal transduction histidine kinase